MNVGFVGTESRDRPMRPSASHVDRACLGPRGVLDGIAAGRPRVEASGGDAPV